MGVSVVLLFGVYIIGAVIFVFATRKCFLQKMTIPQGLALFLLSPPAGYLLAFFINLATSPAVMEETDLGKMVFFAIRNVVIQIAIQGICLALYVKLVKAKNTSLAVFVYICSVMIVPAFMYFTMDRTIVPLLGYAALNFMFYFLVIKSLAKISGEHQVTNAGLFAVLPACSFTFNSAIYVLIMAIYGYTELDSDDVAAIATLLKSEGNEVLEPLKPIVRMCLKTLIYELDALTYTSLFITAILIISFYVIVRNIEYMNEALKAQKEIRALSVEVMEALAHTIDAKDEYTRGHSIRVAGYSKMIAEKMGMSEEECNNIYYMGLLHDIGKIGVPNEIINKPAKLTDEEYDVVKKHPATGSEILAEIKTRPELATGARWHHEKFDGSGYPDHKKAEDIPIEARIIAVADSYDAMTSNRSYRDYLPQDRVRSEIEKNIGTQFDEAPARCMLEIIDEDKDYVLHE